ncbi:MAG: Rad52/Rad22 family DNA repair protein [Bryobacteraceae bacterium]
MQESALVNGAPPVPVAPTNVQSCAAAPALLFTQERVRELVAALEEPFDVTEIRWRVTNTSQIGSRNGPRFRGQMLPYADPRAYTDRLNDLFTPSGWTRDYSVQLVQNFERKERGSAERTITAKIVVTCKVTLYGFATHTGLGEEWADNDNAGTAAEAQAFKRACSCFGLGRYLYDLDGQWVDLDEKKRPLETPRLPDWARPKTAQPQTRDGAAEQQTSGPQHKQNGNGTARNGGGGLYRDELLGQVKALCGTVGFSLARTVLKTVANVEAPEKIRDMAKLTMIFEKLQDLARGVERLRAAVAKAGEQRYATLCREMNLASESIDDIPDRATLRQLLQILEPEAGVNESRPAQHSGGAPGNAPANGESDLGELRGRLLRQAARVSGAMNRTLGDVIQEAAKGAFTLATLRTLGDSDASKVEAALRELERTAVAR